LALILLLFFNNRFFSFAIAAIPEMIKAINIRTAPPTLYNVGVSYKIMKVTQIIDILNTAHVII